ncbi:hypothetical protein PT287_09580 [Lactobacillus sp. ESL0679]|uniref:hypothetical protein n=1 Tax=Lactobacillus sp. ESL0679 TaxID=2983209 RepID=UPI0023F8895B|nr:hypothetical protein [Lactobacillus sp. ESL0679]MDF7683747.1 hypothetical protein [Lactobacillus sp. ESL0679]
MRKNSKVWQYFCWVIAAISILLAVATKPKRAELIQTNNQIAATNQEISNLKNQKNSSNHEKTFDITQMKLKASESLTNSLEMALGGYKTAAEFQQHSQELAKVLSPNFEKTLYKMNGNPDEVYDKKDDDKFKFVLADKATANVAFNDTSDLHHAQITAIVRYKPNYLKYGVIKIINFDYDLTRQAANSAKIVSLQNGQLKGYYDTDD